MENNSKFSFLSKVDQSNTINNYNITLTDEQFKEYLKSTNTSNTKNDIQTIINTIFEDAAKIVNKSDSIFYISKNDKETLKEYIDKLEIFKPFFKDQDEQTTMFFKNIISILIRIDSRKILSLFYELPSYLKNDDEILYNYGCALSENKLYDDAINIFDEIYNKSHYIYAFIQKILCLLLQKKYDIVYNLTKVLKKDEFDQYGYLASYYLISKFERENLTENQIKKLNAKFNDKPLFYSTASLIIKTRINRKSKNIKDYVKKGITLLEGLEFSISVTTIFVEQCTNLGVERYISKYLIKNANGSIHLNSLLLNFLIKIKDKKEEEFKTMRSVIDFLEKEKTDIIDINKAKAQLSLDEHKQLEAIKYLSVSFDLEENEDVASKCLQLIINNHDDNKNISNYIKCLKKSKNPRNVMLAAHGLQFIKNQSEAKSTAIQSLYLLGNKYDKDIYRWFWGISMFDEDKKDPNLEFVSCNTATILQNTFNNTRKVIIIDDSLTELHSIMDAECYPRNDPISISLINKEKNEEIKIENNTYQITEILTKDCYFTRKVMQKLRKSNKNNKYFKEFTFNENSDDPFKEIKELLIKDREYLTNKLEQYDVEKNNNTDGFNSLPLSFFCDEDKNYQSIIDLLLYNKDMKLYCGSTNMVNINNQNIVVDLTSLVLLKEINKLELITPFIKNMYITKSLKNKVNSIFQKVSNEKEKTMRLFVDDCNNLCSTETTKESKKNDIDFWRDILLLINQCNVVEFESNLNSDHFDKSQFDMFSLAIEKNMIYICDDLTIAKLVYSLSKGNTTITNSCSFINSIYKSKPTEYIKTMHNLTELKYIHCIDCLSLFYLTINVLNIQNEAEYRNYYKEIIHNILQSKFLYECHISTIYQFLSVTFKLFKVTPDSNELFDIILEETKERSKEFKIEFDIKNREQFYDI